MEKSERRRLVQRSRPARRVLPGRQSLKRLGRYPDPLERSAPFHGMRRMARHWGEISEKQAELLALLCGGSMCSAENYDERGLREHAVLAAEERSSIFVLLERAKEAADEGRPGRPRHSRNAQREASYQVTLHRTLGRRGRLADIPAMRESVWQEALESERDAVDSSRT